jgi:hypothetical protein
LKRFLLILLVCLSFITACGPATPSVDEQISIAVQQTIAAIPTFTPYPPPRILPTPTLVNIAGLFCEYQFCIGHPAEMAFFDVSAQRNPTAPSTAAQGLLAAYNANLFIQFVWQDAPGRPTVYA